jgi:hypothetical protein
MHTQHCCVTAALHCLHLGSGVSGRGVTVRVCGVHDCCLACLPSCSDLIKHEDSFTLGTYIERTCSVLHVMHAYA